MKKAMYVYVSAAMHKKHKGYKGILKISSFMINRQLNSLGVFLAESIDICLAVIW